MKMRFCDLPKGAKFKYPHSEFIWVAIETYGNGLVAHWAGYADKRQSLCSFVDDDWTLESEVEIVDSDLTVEKLKAHIRKLLEMGEFYAGAIESDRDFRENYDFEDWEKDAKELLK